jgi:hypothetical protein
LCCADTIINKTFSFTREIFTAISLAFEKAFGENASEVGLVSKAPPVMKPHPFVNLT